MKMDLYVGKCYKINVERMGRYLTYDVKVLESNKNNVKIETFSCHIITFSRKEILSYKEIDCPKQEKNIKITTRRKSGELKKMDEPNINL